MFGMKCTLRSHDYVGEAPLSTPYVAPGLIGLCELSREPPHSGLRRPKSWPKVEKDSDMIEILYTKVFGVAEFENEGKSKK